VSSSGVAGRVVMTGGLQSLGSPVDEARMSNA
jgi:hypothetical protein